MKKNISLIAIVLSIAVLSGCGCTKTLNENAVFDPKYPETPQREQLADSILKVADYFFMRNNYFVELYVRDSTSMTMQQVPTFYENLPSDIESTYNMIRYEDGNIMYVAEFPYSPTREWENIYESFFDKDGSLVLFTRQSSFIVENKAMYEKSTYLYDIDHKLLKKTYTLKDNTEKELSETEISFPFRFPYKQYKTREAWLKAHKLKQ